MQNDTNRGIKIFNHKSSTKKTVVVMGVARSGTTMVAAALEKLGVNMGSDGYENNYESRDAYHLIENFEAKAFAQYVKQQNEKYEIWGWKRPGSLKYVKKFEPLIRNPYYIIPFRDYMAIAARNSYSMQIDLKKNLLKTHKIQYAKVIDFVEQNQQPIMLFSYEKAINGPEYFVKQLASFLEIKDVNKIENAIQSIQPNQRNYQNNNNAQRFSGRIDGVHKNCLIGWVKMAANDEPVKVDLYVDKKFIKSFVADLPRHDLIIKNIGNYSFSINIDDLEIPKKNRYVFSIKIAPGNNIRNSPFVWNRNS